MLNMGWAHILILDNIPSRKCRLVKSIRKFTMELLTNYSLIWNRVIWIVNVCLVTVNVQAFMNKLPMMEIAKDLNTKNGKSIKPHNQIMSCAHTHRNTSIIFLISIMNNNKIQQIHHFCLAITTTIQIRLTIQLQITIQLRLIKWNLSKTERKFDKDTLEVKFSLFKRLEQIWNGSIIENSSTTT